MAPLDSSPEKPIAPPAEFEDCPAPAQLRGQREIRVYGAPRVFDLYTILAVTLAFALLVSGMQLLRPLFQDGTTTSIVFVALFVSGIAICQAVLFSGNQPRLASVIAGPLMLLSLSTALGIASGNTLSEAATTGLCSTPLGIFFGYLGGTIVAGVFLVADGLRHVSFLKGKPTPSADEDVGFDHIE